MKAGPLAGKQFVLFRNPTVLGSAPKADVYLFKDGAIEPRHALIHDRGGRFEIEDMNTADGTYVNGVPVSRQILKSGDQIVLGKTVLEFALKESRIDSLRSNPGPMSSENRERRQIPLRVAAYSFDGSRGVNIGGSHVDFVSVSSMWKKLKAPDKAAGKSSSCPGCGNKVTCPEPVYDAEVVEMDVSRRRNPKGLIHSQTSTTTNPTALPVPQPACGSPADDGRRPARCAAR